MRHVLDAAYDTLAKLLAEYREALDGVPDDVIATWKPATEGSGGGEMNTFAGMVVHTAAAGGWMLHHQVYGDEIPRNREAEFRAIATSEEIGAVFDGWLASFRERIDAGHAVDLSALPPTIRDSVPSWTRAHWLFHMIDHTALHLGHAQIHRQLWLTEQAGRPQ